MLTGSGRARSAGRWVTAASGLSILLLTLTPQTVHSGRQGFSTTDLVLNIVLFFPLGVGLALFGVRAWAAALIGGLSSACIELAQSSLIPGRDGSMHDVISNLAGTIAGVLMALYWPERQRWWRRVGGPVSGVIALFASLGGILVLPASAPDRPWYVQWQHDFGAQERFRGRVLSLRYEGLDLPDGTTIAVGQIRGRIARADTTVFDLVVVTGSQSREEVQIAGIVMGWPGPHLLNVLQMGNSLIVRPRLALSEWGFASPAIQVRDALPDFPGDTVLVQVRTSRKAVQVLVRGRATRQATLRLSADLAWLGFSPGDFLGPGSSATWWLRGLASMAAFTFLGLASVNRRWLQGAGFLGWILGGPLLFGIAPSPLAVIALGFTGLILGNLLGRALVLP